MSIKIKYELIQEVLENDEYVGFCLECGARNEGIEPDAKGYECEECTAMSVYGAQEIVIMDMVDTEE